MRTPNLLVVPVFFCAVAAFADPPEPPPVAPVPLTETFRDWVLLRSPGEPGYLARRDEFAPAYARMQEAGTDPRYLEVRVFRVSYTDDGAADSVLAVEAAGADGLVVRIYRRQGGAQGMAIRLPGNDTDIPVSRLEPEAMNRPPDAGLPSFRGGWTRPIRVRGPDGTGLVSSDQTAIESLPAALRLPAAALRESDPAAFARVVTMAQNGEDVALALEHALHDYPPSTPAVVVMDGDRADVWASMHPVERAVISRLPAAEQVSFRQRIAAARTPAAAQALLGEIRRAATAYISSGGNPTALQTLQAAMGRLDAGNVTFDGAAPATDVVSVAGQRTGTDATKELAGVINARGGSRNRRTGEPPGPGSAVGSGEGGGGGLMGMLRGLMRSPLFAIIAGVAIGAGIGFLAGGPFGAFMGGMVGIPGGLIAGKRFFGMRYGGEN